MKMQKEMFSTLKDAKLFEKLQTNEAFLTEDGKKFFEKFLTKDGKAFLAKYKKVS